MYITSVMLSSCLQGQYVPYSSETNRGERLDECLLIKPRSKAATESDMARLNENCPKQETFI